MKRHSGEKNAKDHPLDVCDSSDMQGTRKASSKQRDLYELEYMKVGEGQAATQIAPDFKEKCSRDRIWIKHAYLQGTELPAVENRPNGDTDALDCTRGSKQQIEHKRAGSLIAKKLHSNQESPETFTAECFTTNPSVVCSSPKSSNKSLQLSKLEAAESKHKFAGSTETNVHDRSINEKLSPQKECCKVGMQTQSHIEMDSTARNTDDKGDVLAKFRVKPAGSQKEETKASAVSTKSTAAILVTETGSTKSTRIEGLSVNSPGFQRKEGAFHKRTHHEYEDIDNIMSGEYQSFIKGQRTKLHSDGERRLTTSNKALKKQASLQSAPEEEADTLECHHSAQHGSNNMIDCNSNMIEKAFSYAPLNTVSESPRDVVQKKSSHTARTIESMEKRPVETKSTNEGINLLREKGESQARKVELTQRKAHNRPVIREMVELKAHNRSVMEMFAKHAHKSSCNNYNGNREIKPMLLNQGKDQKRRDFQISKDESVNARANTFGNQDITEESEPELPERGYLEDIDFVVSEFDMILRRNPELPARAYLEDIDFICKEFNFFFRKKSRHQLKEEPKISCHSAEFDPEADGSNSDATTEDDEDDDNAFLSEVTVLNKNIPCDHEPPTINSKQHSDPVVYINHPLLNVPHTSASHGMASENQCQPLMSATTMQDPSSCGYNRVAFTPPRSPLQVQEAVKSQKEDQDIDDITASSTAKLDESYYQPLLFESHNDPEEDYCIPFTLSAENSNNSDKPHFISKQQQRSLQFLPICTSFKTHENSSHRADSLLPGQTTIGAPIAGDNSDTW